MTATANALAEIEARPQIVLVVAVADNGVIGSRGAIPWRLKSDMHRLKAMTLGKPVVMGRKTFASIGRPLRAVALGDALRRSAGEIAVIGGAEIYAQWMEHADRLEITEVHARPEGDTYLAAIDAADWEEVARLRNSAGSDDSSDFSYVTYRRRKSH